MPLDRAHITRASRVMLPAYPLFFAAFGLALYLTPPEVMQNTPSFRTAASITPLRVWGVVLVATAGFQAGSLLLDKWSRRPRHVDQPRGIEARSLYLPALGVGFLCMVIWAGIFVYAAIEGGAPWSAPIWPSFVAVACLASMVSLESRETR